MFICSLFFMVTAPSVYAVDTDDVEFELIYEDKVKLARSGDVDAQMDIAAMFENGTGTSQNYKSALKWYTLAATQGNREAQFKVGIFYYLGYGTARDPEKAYDYLITPAIKGNAKAQFYIGQMHEKGEGASKHLASALIWYQKAEAGNLDDAHAAVARLQNTVN